MLSVCWGGNGVYGFFSLILIFFRCTFLPLNLGRNRSQFSSFKTGSFANSFFIIKICRREVNLSFKVIISVLMNDLAFFTCKDTLWKSFKFRTNTKSIFLRGQYYYLYIIYWVYVFECIFNNLSNLFQSFKWTNSWNCSSLHQNVTFCQQF